MTESKKESSPVRTLTVKNFSVIKEATLEFGKITVLIGPQSSGKSLLCKLAYFFQQIVMEQAAEAIKASDEFESFLDRIKTLFILWFEANVPPNTTAEIDYSDGDYQIWLEHRVIGKSMHQSRFETSAAVRERYDGVLDALRSEKQRPQSLPDPRYFAQQLHEALLKLRIPRSPEVYSYVPATRSFFLSIHQAILGTARRLDDLALRFSQNFSYGFESRIPRPGLDHPLTIWINQESERILQGNVIPAGSDLHFKSTDGRVLMLPVLSSGTQELLPLLTCIREYVAASAAVAKALDLPQALHERLFFLEEPESNVFPSTQYDLVRIFARMTNEPVLDAYWVITTHSPYILTSFNTLIEAWRAGNRPGKREQVAALIPEKYWIDEKEFAAYSISDGKLESIFENEQEGKEGSGLINGDFLDSVSDRLGGEFDKLLDIEYAE